eukprot:119729-Prymnesium_polylepis.1
MRARMVVKIQQDWSVGVGTPRSHRASRSPSAFVRPNSPVRTEIRNPVNRLRTRTYTDRGSNSSEIMHNLEASAALEELPPVHVGRAQAGELVAYHICRTGIRTPVVGFKG